MKVRVIHQRSKKELAELEFTKQPTLDEIKKAYEAKKKVAACRQAFYFVVNGERGQIIPASREAVSGLNDGDSIMFKDLGPQVAWRTVFLTEYFGPIFAFPLAYYLSPYIHGEQVQLSQTQMYVFCVIRSI